MTPEAKVKMRCRLILDEFDAYYFMPAANGYGRVGVPDIICCIDGKFLAVECKAGTNKPTALQEREIKQIQLAGGAAIVVNESNLDELRSLVRKLAGLT